MKLSTQDGERFRILKQAISNGIVACYVVGSALREIKERGWYASEGYKTFEEFCNGNWGWTKRYCNQLILDAKTINALPEEARKLITSHDAARELSRIPEPLREVVLESASAGGSEPVTAASIRKAAPPPPPPKPKPAVKPAQKPVVGPISDNSDEPETSEPEPGPCDSTGTEIPKEIRGIWEKTEVEAKAIVSSLTAIISEVRNLRESGSVGFVELDYNQTLASLRSAYRDVQRGIPHAVCHSCQGKAAKGCPTCKGRGFVSKFFWDTCVPEEIKKMRGGK